MAGSRSRAARPRSSPSLGPASPGGERGLAGGGQSAPTGLGEIPPSAPPGRPLPLSSILRDPQWLLASGTSPPWLPSPGLGASRRWGELQPRLRLGPRSGDAAKFAAVAWRGHAGRLQAEVCKTPREPPPPPPDTAALKPGPEVPEVSECDSTQHSG